MSGNGSKLVTNDSSCAKTPRPNEIQNCISTAACPEWVVGPWSECSELCGDGIKNRSVICSSHSQNETQKNELCDYLLYRPSRYFDLRK